MTHKRARTHTYIHTYIPLSSREYDDTTSVIERHAMEEEEREERESSFFWGSLTLLFVFTPPSIPT